MVKCNQKGGDANCQNEAIDRNFKNLCEEHNSVCQEKNCDKNNTLSDSRCCSDHVPTPHTKEFKAMERDLKKGDEEYEHINAMESNKKQVEMYGDDALQVPEPPADD